MEFSAYGASHEDIRAGMRKWSMEMGIWNAEMEIVRLEREKVIDVLWYDPDNSTAAAEKAALDQKYEQALKDYEAARKNYQVCRQRYMQVVNFDDMTLDWDLPNFDC